MTEENVFFLPVKQFCRRPVVTCAPDDRLLEVAAVMRERNISGVVVCEGEAPVGVVTDRDLRNKVVSRGEDPRALPVRAVMSSPLISVGEEDFLFEALDRMSRHGIHRVGVVDAAGRLTGIVTDSDILRLQTRSPQQMVRQIEEAGSLEALKELHGRVQGLVGHLTGTGVRTRDLVRLIAHLNDRILLRLIALLRAGRFSALPERFAFVVLGSEGRQEQTLTTDQDNAIVYADDLPAAEVRQIEEFSAELTDSLIAIGVPSCPGGIMAKNAAWRRSLSGWVEVLDHWIASPSPENILNGSMFADLRTLYGDPSLERSLKAHLAALLRRDTAFLMHMAENVQRFAPPLGWFGRIRTERKGEHRGELDVKKAGIFAITEGAKLLALEAGILDGGTRERIGRLVEASILAPPDAEDLLAAFDFLVYVRLRGQVEAVRAGRAPTNHIALDHLNRMEKGRLRLALEGVASFQGMLQRHFRLNQM
jgi:CBS domain-containing protein